MPSADGVVVVVGHLLLGSTWRVTTGHPEARVAGTRTISVIRDGLNFSFVRDGSLQDDSHIRRLSNGCQSAAVARGVKFSGAPDCREAACTAGRVPPGPHRAAATNGALARLPKSLK